MLIVLNGNPIHIHNTISLLYISELASVTTGNEVPSFCLVTSKRSLIEHRMKKAISKRHANTIQYSSGAWLHPEIHSIYN